MFYKAFIEHLRNGEPRPKWIIAALVLLGLWGIYGTLCKISSAEQFQSTAWIGLVILSWSSALLIWQKLSWGKRLGQAAIILLCLLIIFSVGYEPPNPDPDREKMLAGKLMPFFLFLFDFIFIVIPSYFAFKYIGRLSDVSLKKQDEKNQNEVMSSVGADTYAPISPTQKYTASLLPFGPFGNTIIPNFLFMTAFIMLFFLKRTQFFDLFPLIFFPSMLLFIFGPNLYNQLPSPFEKDRKLLESFTGSYSTVLFDVSLNNARILVYEDGLEVRAQLSRYFIPYIHLKKIEFKKELFFKRLHIMSQLPGVPKNLYIGTSSAKQIITLIERAMNSELKASDDDEVNYKKEKVDAASKERNPIKRYFNTAVIILMVEFSILLITGPAIITLKKMNLFGEAGSWEIQNDSYTPVKNSRAPKNYGLVEVIRDSKGEVTSEKYYTRSGKIHEFTYNNDKIIFSDRTSVNFYVLMFFGMSGVLLIFIGMFRKEITPYGYMVSGGVLILFPFQIIFKAL